jgi:hypothetical protein
MKDNVRGQPHLIGQGGGVASSGDGASSCCHGVASSGGETPSCASSLSPPSPIGSWQGEG